MKKFAVIAVVAVVVVVGVICAIKFWPKPVEEKQPEAPNVNSTSTEEVAAEGTFVDGTYTWKLYNPSGTLEISGTGDTEETLDKSQLDLWDSSKVKKIIVKEGIKALPQFLFVDYPALESVELPKSLIGLGRGNFSSCNMLKEFTIPENLKNDLTECLFDLPALESINVDNNKLFASDNGVLYDLENKSLVKYPEAKKDTSYAISDGVERLNSYAFYGADAITELYIPSSMTTLGNAIPEDNNIKSIKFGGTEEQWAEIADGISLSDTVKVDFECQSEKSLDNM